MSGSAKSTYRELFDLEGKVAIVTGGAGILGREFCSALRTHGARVALVDVDFASAQAAANEIGSDVKPFQCDVANPQSVGSMVAGVLSEFGRIDVLHNNAATKSSDLAAFFAPFESYALSTWREVMSVNIDGMFLVAQAVGGQMLKQGGGGSIIQTSSIYGVVGPDQRIYEGSHYLGRKINTPAVYAASKAAVLGLTRYLATYWGESGIRVNSLTPGGVESGQNDEFSKRYASRVPLGRMAHRSDMVGAVVYLASDASMYLTGQNIVVDGGLTCW